MLAKRLHNRIEQILEDLREGGGRFAGWGSIDGRPWEGPKASEPSKKKIKRSEGIELDWSALGGGDAEKGDHTAAARDARRAAVRQASMVSGGGIGSPVAGPVDSRSRDRGRKKRLKGFAGVQNESPLLVRLAACAMVPIEYCVHDQMIVGFHRCPSQRGLRIDSKPKVSGSQVRHSCSR